MKFFTQIALGLSAIFGLVACEKDVAPSGTEKVQTPGGKTLVAYFSASGVTKAVAEKAAEVLKADLFEIVPEQLYTEADLDYRNEESRSSVEMKNPASRPAIKGKVQNMEQYDTVLIGYPIWWAEAPHVVYTFVENNDLSGKRVLPFCTSGSSSPGESAENLSECAASSAVWSECVRFTPTATGEEILQWVRKAK